MKRLSLVLLLLASSARAQLSPASSSSGSITTNAANCNTSNACIILHMATSNIGYSVTVSGTWTGTLTIEQSGDNQGSWTSATTTTSNTLYTSALTPGITDVRVRGSAAMTGTAVVTITASGPAVLQQITQTGAGGAAANSPIPANQAQGPRYNIVNYGAKGTAKKVIDCASTATSKVFTSATAQWTQADVGSVFWMTYTPNSNSNISTSVTTIASVQSATQITIGAGQANQTASASYCFWGPQDDTTSIQAAVTAADVANTNKTILSGPTLAMPGNIYAPEGGYIVSGMITSTCVLGTGNQICPNFYGAGPERTNFYITPNFTGTTHQTFLWISGNSIRQTIGGFSVTDGGVQIGADLPFIYVNGTHVVVKDISFTALGWQKEVIQCDTCSYSLLENINGAGSCQSCTGSLMTIVNGSGMTLHNVFVSNGNTNLKLLNVSLRTSQGTGALLDGVSVDECGSATVACTQIVNSNANIVGGAYFGNAIGAISVDGTSTAYLTDVNAGQFNTGNNGIGVNVTAGGKVYATGSTIRGNNTTAAVNGPATAFWYDLGGNSYQNCSGSTCTDITLANWATLGFTGGIVPVFPLAINATTQLGGRQIVAGTAPTCSVTGAGSTATCTVDTGSTDAAGKFTITANGAGIAALGTFTLTFTTGSGAFGTNGTNCSSNFMNGTGAWNVRAGAPIYTTLGTTTSVANWDNNAVALTGGSTYKVSYTCYGQ